MSLVTGIDAPTPNVAQASAGPPRRRQRLFGIDIDAIRLDEAVAPMLAWCAEPQSTCRLVVTPNVDHIVMLQHNPGFREVYRVADLVLADGWPVVWASRRLSRPLPERVAGSDLVPAVFRAAHGDGQPLRCFLLGAAPGVAARSAHEITLRWPSIVVADVYSPPLGFEGDDRENDRILRRIAAAAPQLLVVGLGAPKQELWVHRFQSRLAARVAICGGATIDFLAGHRRRAPQWVQRAGLEWLHRLLGDPRRLAHRYCRDAYTFPRLVWREHRAAARCGRLTPIAGPRV